MHFSFENWPYPNKKAYSQKLAWSHCGLLLYAINNNFILYSEEEKKFVPLAMWKPEEHEITALEWFDASNCPAISLPIIVFAANNGRIYVYDVRARKNIVIMEVKQGYVTSLKWCPYSNSTLYYGSSTGTFAKVNIDLGEVPNAKKEWELTLPFEIDYISIDETKGTIAALASKNGNFAYVSNLDDQTSLHISDSNFISLNDSNQKNRQVINCVSFIPNRNDSFILGTLQGILLFFINSQLSVQLWNFGNVLNMFFPDSHGNGMVLTNNNSLQYCIFDGNSPKCISSIPLSILKTNSNSFPLVVSRGNKIAVVSNSYWLSMIVIHRQKLFISGRIRLFNSKPLDWSFNSGSIAFVTKSGSLMISENTPSSIPSPDLKIMDSIVFEEQNIKKSSQNKKPTSSSDTVTSKSKTPSKPPNLPNSDISKTTSDSIEQGTNSSENPIISFIKKVQKDGSTKTEQSKQETVSTPNSETTNEEISNSQKPVNYQPSNPDFNSSQPRNVHTKITTVSSIGCINASPHNEENEAEESSPFSLSPPPNFAKSTDEIDIHIATRSIVSPRKKIRSYSSLNPNLMPLLPNSSQQSFTPPSPLEQDHPCSEVLEESLLASQKEAELDSDIKLEVKPISSPIKNRKRTMTIDSRSSDQILAEIAHLTKNTAKDSFETKKKQDSEINIHGIQFGNSTLFTKEFQISSKPLNHIKWLRNGIIITWNDDEFFAIDINKRKIDQPLKQRISSLKVAIKSIEASLTGNCIAVNLGEFLIIYLVFSKRGNFFQIGSLTLNNTSLICFCDTNPLVKVNNQTDKKDQKLPLYNSIIVSKDGSVFLVTIDRNTKRLNLHGNGTLRLTSEVTSIFWKKYLFIGTLNGTMYQLNFEKMIARTIFYMRGAVKFISQSAPHTIYSLDREGHIYIWSNKVETMIGSTVKNLKPCLPNIFLAQENGKKYLSVIDYSGNHKIIYSPSIMRTPIMWQKSDFYKKLTSKITKILEIPDVEKRYDEISTVCQHFGIPFINKMLSVKFKPDVFKERALMMNSFFAESPLELHRRMFVMTLLLLNDFNSAEQKLLKTSPTDSNFVINQIKASLFDAEISDQKLKRMVENLMHSGQFNELYDILLITKHRKQVIQEMTKITALDENIQNLLIFEPSEISSYLNEEALSHLIMNAFNGSILDLLLFMKVGLNDEIINYFEKEGELELTNFMRSFLL